MLAVDAERERISLGIKQLADDPFSRFLAENTKGSVVKGTVTEVDAKGATIGLADGVEGYLRASEVARERVDDTRTLLNVGDEIEAKFIGVDRKKRVISLSIKAKESDDEAAVLHDYSADAAGGTTTLGDLLREQLDQK